MKRNVVRKHEPTFAEILADCCAAWVKPKLEKDGVKIVSRKEDEEAE